MYCVKCGIELTDSQAVCPLCQTTVYHPDIPLVVAEKPYPDDIFVPRGLSLYGKLLIASFLFLLILLVPPICDFSINASITWSSYSIVSVLYTYVLFVLPYWFKAPTPYVYCAVDYLSTNAFLLAIEGFTDGEWFISLAFPIITFIILLTVFILFIVKNKKYLIMFSMGITIFLIGVLSVVTEFCVSQTFCIERMFVWSQYPLTILGILGILVMVIGMSTNVRKALYKRFFI